MVSRFIATGWDYAPWFMRPLCMNTAAVVWLLVFFEFLICVPVESKFRITLMFWQIESTYPIYRVLLKEN